MALSKSPQAFRLKTLFMGSLGEIPESHARTVDKKQLAAWIKEGPHRAPPHRKALRPHPKGENRIR